MAGMKVNLANKVAVVTGSNRGIGKGIALALAEAGASIVLADQNIQGMADTTFEIEKLKGKALIQQVDIAQESQVVAMAKKAVDTFGRIDILVNNAGGACRAPAEETTLEQWKQMLDVNLTGTFLCGREIGKVMIRQKSGKIVNLVSINATVARPNLSAYAASKAGVMQLTKCWAFEWADYNINVNAIGPSFVETEMSADYLKQEEVRNYLFERLPLKRFGKVEDVSSAVLFLVSEASDYITGHTLFVDGGWIVQ